MDLSALLYGDDDEAKQQMLAQAAALRRQDAVGLLGQISGDKVLGQLGQHLMSGASQGETQLGQVPQLRLKRALEQQQLAQAQASSAAGEKRRTALADPASVLSKTRAALAAQFGIPLPAGSPGDAIDDKELELGEKASVAKDNRLLRQTLATMGARNKEVNVGEKEKQFNTKREDVLAKQLGEAIDPFRAKGGLKNYADAVGRAEKVKALVVDPATGMPKKNLDTREMAELAMALQGLVSAGHVSQSEVEHLIPHTFWGDVSKAKEYFGGHPADAGQQAFATKMLHSAEREAKVNRDQMVGAFKQRIPAVYAPFSQLNRGRLEATLKGAGIDPGAFDDMGLVKPGMEMMLGAEPAAGGGLRQGEIRMLDKNGKPHAVPADQADDAIAHGWRKG